MARDPIITREQVEDFLYREAALLDEWRLDEWLQLLTDDARYRVPSNDAPEGDPAGTLFTIADDMQRLRGRVRRLQEPNGHPEVPHSRTRRLVTNVRILHQGSEELRVEANFALYRFPRDWLIVEYGRRY